MSVLQKFITWLKPPKPGVANPLFDDERFTSFDFESFQKVIGYTVRNKKLFLEALLHRSFLQFQTKPHQRVSNERLEFLGDSILDLIVGKYLFNRYPNAEEGELTKIRSRLVNRKALVVYARELELNRFMFMSTSAEQAVGKGNDSILADAYEAIIAAIYLDGSFEEARRFVERQVLAAVNKGILSTSDDNYKSMLLEYAQGHGYGIPRYGIVKEEGPDHDRVFTVEVTLADECIGSGSGRSKKEAEQQAAEQGLEHILRGESSITG
jgi:ribonuclease-3